MGLTYRVNPRHTFWFVAVVGVGIITQPRFVIVLVLVLYVVAMSSVLDKLSFSKFQEGLTRR